jgi:hypothetical protein
LLQKTVAVLVSHEITEQPYLRVRVKAYVFDHRFESRLRHDITCRAHERFQQLGAFQHSETGQ